jgi:hypothetical protein
MSGPVSEREPECGPQLPTTGIFVIAEYLVLFGLKRGKETRNLGAPPAYHKATCPLYFPNSFPVL